MAEIVGSAGVILLVLVLPVMVQASPKAKMSGKMCLLTMFLKGN